MTMRVEDEQRICGRVDALLQQARVREFKWSKLAGGRYRDIAIAMSQAIFDLAQDGLLRGDVLIWDTLDRRHSIPMRDDVANFDRMAYQLLRNGCAKRWRGPKRWELRPDENSVDWEMMQHVLGSGDGAITRKQNRLVAGFRGLPFEVTRIKPVKSHDEPLVQCADLLAGLGVFSHAIFDKGQWPLNGLEACDLYRHRQVQRRLDGTTLERKLSNSEMERVFVLREFVKRSKKAGWHFRLQAHQGLRSWHQWPVNFWVYTPKNPKDRAPLKRPSPREWYGLRASK